MFLSRYLKILAGVTSKLPDFRYVLCVIFGVQVESVGRLSRIFCIGIYLFIL